MILFVPCPLIIDILSSLGMLEPCDAVQLYVAPGIYSIAIVYVFVFPYSMKTGHSVTLSRPAFSFL